MVRAEHAELFAAERREHDRALWLGGALLHGLRDREQRDHARCVVVGTEVALAFVIVMRPDEDDLVADVWIAALHDPDDIRGVLAGGLERQLEVLADRLEAEAPELLDDERARLLVAVGAGRATV